MEPNVRRLTLSHFAFYRAYLEGSAAIDVRFLAARYLATGTDPRRVRVALRWLQHELAAAARRIGDQEALRLLRLPKEKDEVSTPDETPTLEEYRELEDPDGVWTEAELQALFRAAYPEASLSSSRKGTLRERRLAALRRLESAVAESPANTHPVHTWFDPSITQRLQRVNILTLGELIATINTFGYRWFARIPKLGPEAAQRIVTWLQANEGALRPGVSMHATTPLRGQSVTALEDNRIQAADIACFENVTVPQTLSGAEGTNRAASERNQTGANDDWQAIQTWLSRHPLGSATWRSYRT